MMNGSPKVSSESTILVFGSLTAVLLLAVLMNGLRSDLRSELNEGGHRVNEVALNVAQMLRSPLRSSVNAMTFIAEESGRLQRTVPQQSDALLKDIVAQTLRRQPQFLSIAFTKTGTPGGSPTIPGPESDVLASCDMYLPTVAKKVCFATVVKTPRGWTLPLSVPLEGGQWVVGDIQVAALKRTVANAPHADDIFFEVVDAHGQKIVEGGNPAAASVAVEEPREPWWIRKLFGIHRSMPLRATVAVELYPFTVNAGMTYQKALVPWRGQVLEAVSFYFLYLSAFMYLLWTVTQNAKMQRYYIQSLQAKTSDLHTAQRIGRTAIWALCENAQCFCCDDADEILGMPPGKTTASVKEFLALVAPPDRLPLVRHVRSAWVNNGRLHTEFHIKRLDGSIRRLSAGGQVVVDEAGTKRMTGTVVDVTEQWQARQQQAESEHRFRSLFEHNPLPFWVFDASTLRFLEVNATAVRVYGYSRDEFLGMTILDIREPEDRVNVVADVTSPRDARQAPKIWLHKTKEGKTIDVRIHSADIVFNGRPARLILAEDITAHLADERELAYRASHDLITRLPNQRTLMAWMDALIAEKSAFDIAYIQLLGMDAISDTFGINVASGVLQAVAVRLAELVGDNEFLATVNHEAFALATASGRLTNAKLETVSNAITEPLYYEDTQHQIDIVIGVASHPQDGAQSNALFARAALAAHAYLGSEQPIHYFESSLAQKSKEKLHFAACLRRAVKRHEFEMYYQPITNYPDMRLIGLEALIRWPQEDGTVILPSSFIPICEESGLIVPLGRWVFHQVAKASREIREAGFDSLPIGVNVSPTELHHSDLVENLRAVRDAYSLADSAIHIELTESSLIEHKDKAVAVMKQLRADGFAVALDDFGTGFSSLAYLRDLPIDILKIDQAFIRNVDWDARSATICEAIIALGKSLNVRVIAEGIERASQYHWLHQHGCDGAQGFYLSKPQRLAEFLEQWTPAKEKAQ
ncbi:putative bifunctional diguanylate cyclase/phosphodiesterase [Dyella nitratireducens]|uniref:PAS domain S-box-containing protein n=1 Tax=Dyella nitratireducens TaxID=1849580 RepID=A0ABQ1FTK0_9GAMM|nr:GGDEF domain-containing phosphodiesterase [Dyella nitratireducens]GGA30298.1 hypothetical protein GCM10010981_19110 [Dyella nitratireducens]GLQ43025.1 hypothetical protein GCM10007902_28750 [Dyella nitratireducens]